MDLTEISIWKSFRVIVACVMDDYYVGLHTSWLCTARFAKNPRQIRTKDLLFFREHYVCFGDENHEIRDFFEVKVFFLENTTFEEQFFYQQHPDLPFRYMVYLLLSI